MYMSHDQSNNYYKMKNTRTLRQKIRKIIHEQILVSSSCLTKRIKTDGQSFIELADRIEVFLDPANTTSGKKWVFFKLDKRWIEYEGTSKKDEGKWECDGSDNFFIYAENSRWSSQKQDWEIIDPVFTCILNDMVDRHMDYSVKDGQFIIPFKNGAHYVFEKDYKWSNVLTNTGRVLYSGTWKCDGDDEYEISSEGSTYSSKRGWDIKK